MYIKEKKELKDFNGGEVARRIINGEIIYTTDSDRGIGKTTMILKIADILQKPILTTSRTIKKMYEENARAMGLTVTVVYIESGSTPPVGLVYNDFLIDDLSVSEVPNLKKYDNKVSGFAYEGSLLLVGGRINEKNKKV